MKKSGSGSLGCIAILLLFCGGFLATVGAGGVESIGFIALLSGMVLFLMSIFVQCCGDN